MSTDSPDVRFQALAASILDEALSAQPELATSLGDHRFDGRSSDASPTALEAQRVTSAARLRDLDGLDLQALTPDNRVDATLLQNRLARRLFELDVEREHEWNPLAANPGTGIYLLLARDFAPLAERLRALAGRLAAVPEALDQARRSLSGMPRVHVETAIGQFTGTRTLIATEVERALGREPGLRAELEPVRESAYAAVDQHISWLRDRLASANGEARLGPQRFARKLALTLDTTTDPDALLDRAEHDLLAVEERMAELAGSAGSVRAALDGLAEDGQVDDDTIVGRCEAAMETTTDFVRAHELVTVHDDPVEIIVMPEIHRGVAVAYCDPPGPLETSLLPTYFAVAPTPAEWPTERVRSFYREYNAHMLHNLTIHEAMPGHVLQLAHSRRHRGSTQVRAAFWSGSFVEGWAVYAERLMVETGYRSDPAAPQALALQQAKMQLRMIINTILDIRVHTRGMTEREGMQLMLERGHQEEGEAVGKWRRAQLSSTQLSTYYVGFTEVSDLVGELAGAYPGPRALHDEVLAHGSPPARHLRGLISGAQPG